MLDLSQELAEIRPQVDEAIKRVLDRTQFIGGPEVTSFESEAASFLGCKHAIGCNSGTDALLLAMRAAGIGPGDEVITSPFSFFATAEPISLLGAKPVFVEIDAETFNICPQAIEAAVSEKTKAIVPVHLYGQGAPMEAIMAIAKKKNLKVFEDTAQSFGAMDQGKRLGTIGDAGSFSFFPSKTLGAFGDGGMVATNDDDLAQTVRKLRAHGSLIKYQNEILGYNSRLDSIQAAILRVKLPRIDGQNEARLEAARNYHNLLAGIPEVKVPKILRDEPFGHVFHQYTLRISGGKRDQVRDSLKASGIATMIYYPTPIHHLPVYTDNRPELPQVNVASEEALSLPIWPKMDPAIQDRIAKEVKLALAES